MDVRWEKFSGFLRIFQLYLRSVVSRLLLDFNEIQIILHSPWAAQLTEALCDALTSWHLRDRGSLTRHTSHHVTQPGRGKLGHSHKILIRSNQFCFTTLPHPSILRLPYWKKPKSNASSCVLILALVLWLLLSSCKNCFLVQWNGIFILFLVK